MRCFRFGNREKKEYRTYARSNSPRISGRLQASRVFTQPRPEVDIHAVPRKQVRSARGNALPSGRLIRLHSREVGLCRPVATETPSGRYVHRLRTTRCEDRVAVGFGGGGVAQPSLAKTREQIDRQRLRPSVRVTGRSVVRPGAAVTLDVHAPPEMMRASSQRIRAAPFRVVASAVRIKTR